ncbi:MAG: 1-acyl-sn-glycerol-3-phosphate acyltransferase [Acidimicrobiaceae bacterium]|jgi:1-acyl-sn-glycerol-3-phosphate acyltransferase|nr:1-acyl-sn-glycerol-3-phosphate acyltransferase [Acidimicrobiaceae bacterium]
MTYWLLKVILTPLLRFFYRVKVEGMENVPQDGPVILASNHVSFCDSIFLPLVLRRRITFVAKAEYFEDPKTAWFFRAVGQIPIKRGGGSASQRALASAKEILDGGGVFGIYPEGTRSPDGRLYKGHTGVARLALACRCPVLSVAMVGTRQAQPIGQVKPRLFMPIKVRFSAPMYFDRFYDRQDDPLVLRQMTDEIMWQLRELSGQDYVNRYAKRGDAVEAVGAESSAVVAARRAAAGSAASLAAGSAASLAAAAVPA